MNSEPLDPKQVHQLIGGYATGTLTETERQALFAEALNNQTLFDALADEEALRELLADPVARRELLAALEPKQPPLTERISGWLFRPLTMTIAAGTAAVALAVILIPRLTEPARQEVAMHREAPAPVSPAPPVSDQPAAAAKAPESDRFTPRKQVPAGARDDNRVAGQGGSAPLPPPKPLAQDAPPAAGPVQPAAPEPLADSRKSAEEKERQLAQQSAPSVPSQAPPPPVIAGVPAEPARPLPSSLAKSSTAVAPFEYLVEKQVRDGVWAGVDPKAIPEDSDVVRISIQANARGYLRATLRAPNGAVSVLYAGAVAPGATLHLPEQGGLSGQSGANLLTLAYSATPRSNLSVGSLSGFRGPASAAASSRAKKAENTRESASVEVRRDEASQDSQQPYSVEIPLRFR
jgi:hypothetical protein